MENLHYIMLVLSMLAELAIIKPNLFEISSIRFLSGVVIGSTFTGSFIMIINSLV